MYYQEQLEAVYQRIENLELREQNMMKSLQNTMQQHNSIQMQEKQGSLKPEQITEALSKFNYNVKQDFRKY